MDLLGAPWYLVEALSKASNILGLLSAPEEYAPPIEILHHPERLQQHFEGIKRKNGGSSEEEIQHDPTVDVSAAARYRKKMGL